MSAALDVTRGPAPGSIASLRGAGFEGFERVVDLQDNRSTAVPVAPGVYAVARESLGAPEFFVRSEGAHFRGKDPSVPIADLEARWVTGAQVLYLAHASGPGVRSLLQQRIKRYMRFGLGRNVAHVGGRYIWQLRGHGSLLVAWRVSTDDVPVEVEARLLNEFKTRHGRLPFANLEGESEA
jgi:hypothetical protein